MKVRKLINGELGDAIDHKEADSQSVKQACSYVGVIVNERRFLQKRSSKVRVNPGKFSVSCSGHVDEGERFE